MGHAERMEKIRKYFDETPPKQLMQDAMKAGFRFLEPPPWLSFMWRMHRRHCAYYDDDSCTNTDAGCPCSCEPYSCPEIKDMATDELGIPLPNGGWLFCGAGKEHQYGGTITLCDAEQNELIHWDSAEWGEEPELVMGAIFVAALMSSPDLIRTLRLVRVVDGVWTTEKEESK